MMVAHAEAMGVLIQADLDGELDAVQAADLALHMAACEECRALSHELRALKTALRSEVPRYQAPPALREAVLRQASGGKVVALPARRLRLSWRPALPAFGGFFAGAAIAALLAIAILPRLPAEDVRVAAQVATATERSLQPGHMLDMQTKAPVELAQWFHGHMGFAPPMRTPAGFTLAGGRLDYMHHRPVAVLAYEHQGGMVELYTWPEEHTPTPPVSMRSAGYAMRYWREGGVEYWAVSRSPEMLADFVQSWKSAA